VGAAQVGPRSGERGYGPKRPLGKSTGHCRFAAIIQFERNLMPEYSNYQKKVIQRFYENRESGDEQRLAELVTNIYLSSGKKLDKLWIQAEETMVRLKVPKKRVDHLIKSKDPTLIAEVVKELEAGTLRREASPAKPS
jgi:hypothetical protein